MSRMGKRPVAIPAGVSVTVDATQGSYTLLVPRAE